ncbi:MAG: hypothetical protein JSV98_09755 [candidate division WOR-3 bacterium]|nr:MAG: hypothetical protein JSV98_09755 [candidate division WOR-3 bacterium]
MRKIVVITVLIALISCQCTPHYFIENQRTGDPLVVSALVGETIDLEERDKFELFQGISNFREAKFYSSAGGGYEVHIETETQKLIARNRSSDEFLILREYIDSYEEIYESREEFEQKWEIVDYDDLGFPITMNEVNRHRGGQFSWLACLGFGGVIIGLSSVAAVGIAVGDVWPPNSTSPEEKEREKRTAAKVFVGGIMLGVLLGVLVGKNIKKSISEEEALKKVKEARKPSVVKYFSNKGVNDGK